MTRKWAIFKVISQIRAQKADSGQLVAKLKEIESQMPFVKWTEWSVRDCVEHFMAVHKRLPTVTDFKVQNGMPAHAIFPFLFKMTAREWMDKNYPTYYHPAVTVRQALEQAIAVAGGNADIVKKLRELLAEYPLTKWNVDNIKDGLERFFEEHGHLPRREDYQRESFLPFIDIFRYRYKTRRNAWIELNCPDLMRREQLRDRARKKSSLAAFAEEYKRVCPITKDEFDQKRNKADICSADVIMRINGIAGWEELLSVCRLQRYVKPCSPKLITNVVTIVF